MIRNRVCIYCGEGHHRIYQTTLKQECFFKPPKKCETTKDLEKRGQCFGCQDLHKKFIVKDKLYKRAARKRLGRKNQ